MANLQKAITQLNHLEDMAQKNTCIHRCPALSKIAVAFCYLWIVVSFSTYDVTGLLVMTVFPIMIMALAEIPYPPLFKRLLIAIPFVVFTGISNIIIWQETAFWIGSIPISYGILSFVCLFMKTILSVGAVLILIATTPLPDITDALLYIHIPRFLIRQLNMTYHYIGILVGETASMHLAYQLRSAKRGINMKHMGSFVGQMILRSFDRAERVYYAMKCRGYGQMEKRCSSKSSLTWQMWFATIVCCALLLCMRFLPFNDWFGMTF